MAWRWAGLRLSISLQAHLHAYAILSSLALVGADYASHSSKVYCRSFGQSSGTSLQIHVSFEGLVILQFWSLSFQICTTVYLYIVFIRTAVVTSISTTAADTGADPKES